MTILKGCREARDYLEAVQQKYGYEFRSDSILDKLAEKFAKQHEQYGDMYCPCQPNHSQDTVCPCRYMRNYGACRCGLYKPTK